MDILNILQNGIKKLKENHIEEPINKARRILAYILNVKREYLITHENQELTEEQEKEYKTKIEELANGKPIQYILGIQEFMGIEFIVNENVLIPQPDTEILVEKTIELAKNIERPKILDLCTGSGAIAVAISKYVQNAEITASDISKNALEVAKINDKENKIKFIESNLFENIKEKFDIIVSNPPYIRSDEIKTLSDEVQNEPILALDGGKDGLEFYRKIIDQAHEYLKKDGYLCLEIGEDQKKDVMQIAKENENYNEIASYKDFENHDRVIIIK